MNNAHPGFAAVQAKIQGEGYSKKSAGAILAHATRNASAAAKRANPNLKHVKGNEGTLHTPMYPEHKEHTDRVSKAGRGENCY